MEIRAGTGGDEAALFARDLFEMYRYHADDQGLEDRDPRTTARPSSAASRKSCSAIEGEGVLPRAAVRKRRPPRAARARDRNAGPHPHLGRHRRRAARAGRRRSQPQARRLPPRHVLRERPRRSARQQDRIRRAAHALRNRHRRPVPGRKEPAQEQGQGPPRAHGPHLRLQEAEGRRQAGRRTQDASSAPATAASGFAPTTSRRIA